jgi:hypothetical protein
MSECTEWQGTMFDSGYGRLYKDGKSKKAHRVAWEEANGPIPDGLCVCHRCNNKGCVNPDHLYLATSRQNTIDAYKDGLIKPCAGEKHPNSKLTEADVLEIRATDISYGEAAIKYGVSKRLISLVKKREQWRHI